MRRLRRDEGIVLIRVGLLLVALVGIAALAIVMGAVYSERRQLRNGADAAALAIAEDCGTGAKSCDQGTAEGTAQWYADANSDDGASGVQVAFPESGRVRVVTSAIDGKAGLAGVRVPLMSLFGVHRVNVTAAATALFGYPVSGFTLPLVIDAQEYPLGPPYVEDFSWLDSNGECPMNLTAGWARGSTDDEPECSAQYLRNNVYEHDVLVPLYSEENEPDNRYKVAGFAYFHVTGYKLSPSGDLHTWPADFTCEGGAPVCLRGYFFEKTVSSGTPGGRDFGVVLVKLVE